MKTSEAQTTMLTKAQVVTSNSTTEEATRASWGTKKEPLAAVTRQKSAKAGQFLPIQKCVAVHP